jgi:hypothetical protein
MTNAVERCFLQFPQSQIVFLSDPLTLDVRNLQFDDATSVII